jgi:CBS domain-containing protein
MLSDTIATVLNAKGSEVYSVLPEEKALEAVRLMAREGVAAVVVISDGQPTGIVSAKDFGRRVVLEGRSLEDTKVGDIMTSPLITVSPATTVSEAMAVMAHNRIRHLPVMDDHDELAGIVTMGDLVRSVIAEQAFAIDQLHRYVGHRYPA